MINQNMEKQKEKVFAVILTAILSIFAISAGVIYSDGSSEMESSAGTEIESVEKGQSLDENSTSTYYMVKLANSSEFYYWKKTPEPKTECESENSVTICKGLIQEGYAEIKADISKFRETEGIYLGQKYAPKGSVCAREITRKDIEIYDC